MRLVLRSLLILIVSMTTRASSRAQQVAASPASRPADHVVVISIDGFHPALYGDPDRERVRIPNLPRSVTRAPSPRASKSATPR